MKTLHTIEFTFEYKKLDDNNNVIDFGSITETNEQLFRQRATAKLKDGYQIKFVIR